MFTWYKYNLLVVLISCVVTGVSFFLEYHIGLIPCVLCSLERYLIINIGLSALVNLILLGYFRWTRFLGLLSNFYLIICGLLITARHVYLQFLPAAEIPSCSASLEQMLRQYPDIMQFAQKVLSNTDCGKEDFTILWISLPGWSMLIFILLAILSLAYLFGKKTS